MTLPTKRPYDAYSDEFSEVVPNPERWTDASSGSSYDIVSGTLTTTIGAGTDYSRLTNLVTLLRTTDATIALDLAIEFEMTWNITTDFAVATQEAQVGWACTFADASRRRLVFQDAQGQGTPLAKTQDAAGATLGSTLALPAGSPGQAFFRIERNPSGDFKFQAKVLAADPWTTLRSETITSEIVSSEMFAQQKGAAAPAWAIKFQHDYLRRVTALLRLGSVADVSYARGTVPDDSFIAILDRLKADGLRLIIKES